MGMHNRRNTLIAGHTETLSPDNSRGDTALLSAQDGTSGLNLEIPIDDPNQIVLHKEMFLEMCNAVQRGVFLKEEFLDFGFGRAGMVSEPRTVTVVNSFVFPIEIHWVTGSNTPQSEAQ